MEFSLASGDPNSTPDESLLVGDHQFPDISPALQATLQRIASDVVTGLGCVGAMVATLEPNNTLPVRAYAVDISPTLIKQLEAKLGISIVGPKSVAYLDNRKYKDNLGVRAVKGHNGQPEKYLVSDSLHDLFRPAVSKPMSFLAQQATGIKQAIAVPFYLEDEVVGNLFAATRTEFSRRDIGFLTALGHQAASAIQGQRRLDEAQALEDIIFDLQASLTNETQAFKVITDAVVEKLGYLAAAVAPRIGQTLPVRAYSVNKALITQEFIDKWQHRLGFQILGDRAVAYLDRADYAEQLSVRAIKNGQVQTSASLYDLVRPILPRLPIVTLQRLLRIKQVISIPFFLKDEAVGNLYVISQRPRFSAQEQQVLKAFAEHAAISIRNAQLYRKSENMRETAQIFAKMAFSSAAYIHALRNHIGAFRMYQHLIRPHLDGNFQRLGDNVITRLDQAADILDNLHEPWRQQPDTQTHVNLCLNRAIQKIIPDRHVLQTKDSITLHTTLSNDLPPLYTSPDMLTEAFRVLVKNAVEAVKEKLTLGGRAGNVWVKSNRSNDFSIEILICDDGIGIEPENIDHIFELGWSTKKIGMGFGLFWVKDYVEGLGGSLRVQSVWQEGTTFRVQFPVSSRR